MNGQCIFCRGGSAGSHSIEHIIPESLGNTDHILPAGIVCDACNTYFAIKVEKPFLDCPFMRHARHRNEVESKKGLIPPLEDVIGPGGIRLGMSKDGKGIPGVYAVNQDEEQRWIDYVMNAPKGMLIVPVPKPTAPAIVGRFLAKVALEAMAYRLLGKSEFDEFIYHEQLDALREYARRGGSPWLYNERRIYSEDHAWIGKDGSKYEVLHEWDFLATECGEIYFVVAIFGIEYALNMGGSDIEGYLSWLHENSHVSPLYRSQPPHK